MSRVVMWVAGVALVIGLAGVVYLMFAEVPAPVTTVEQVVPNDRLATN